MKVKLGKPPCLKSRLKLETLNKQQPAENSRSAKNVANVVTLSLSEDLLFS